MSLITGGICCSLIVLQGQVLRAKGDAIRRHHFTRDNIMLSDAEFADLMARTRSGDQEAAMRLVREYEPEIRRAARLRLTDPKLRRIVDSIDICQSVFGRFFRSATDGSFDLERPEQLLVLLTTMTRNRIIDEHRKQTAAKRSGGGDLIDGADPGELIADTAGPRTAAVAKEMLSEIRSRLSPEELNLADRRNSGQSWDEIARDLGESPDTVRKRLERALQRVREELNVATGDDK
ncbi:MAG: sigma-70 family RNA polymerase sigma factor [Planctomycetaceae bacterium]|nr:sigma-70 family RNA polymerase sigma factor [Planctomycetaceae bacterium]